MLHVGLGTFRPVKVENIEEHEMHAEFYQVTAEAAAEINQALAEGRRIIAVGSTSHSYPGKCLSEWSGKPRPGLD